MIGALYIGENGLFSKDIELDAISNNLSNLNTVGFKRSNVNFQDLLYHQIHNGSLNPSQVGTGTSVASTNVDFSQGALIDSNVPTSMAISGSGMFVLKGQNGEANKLYYSRAGDFSFDGSGNLVNPNGNMVMGWQSALINGSYNIAVDPTTGLPTGTLSPINTSGFQTLPAIATTQIKISANLNSGNSVKEKSAAVAGSNLSLIFNNNGDQIPMTAGDDLKVSFNGGADHLLVYGTDFSTLGDLSDKIGAAYAADTGNSASDISVSNGQISINNSGTASVAVSVLPGNQSETGFDTIMENLSGTAASGKAISTQQFYTAAHAVHSYFYDTSGNKHLLNIDFKRTSDTTWSWQANSGDLSGTLSGNSGNVVFNQDGTLIKTTASPTINYTPTGKTNIQPIKLNLWNTDSGSFAGNDSSGLTSFAIDSNTNSLNVDGNSAGSLNAVQTDANGNINGVYSNGKTVPLAKIAIASFSNYQGLYEDGNSLYSQTANSGVPDIGISGTRGVVIPEKLEQSNVSLSSELVDMLTSQRGFQADSKSITTADSMLQTAIQLKR